MKLDPAERRRHLLAERSRTMDQIKRLYAVVMGFAVTTTFTGAYQVVRMLERSDHAHQSVVLAQVFCFVTLILLFYLGAERLLDRRYLQLDSKVPTWRGLGLDIAVLGITAGWFVVLADTVANPNHPEDLRSQILSNQTQFMSNLWWLFLLDLVLLLIQTFKIRWEALADWQDDLSAHLVWLCLNVGSLIVVDRLLMMRSGGHLKLAGFELNRVAVYLALLHLVRAGIDFRFTFRFYYPPKDLPEVPPATSAPVSAAA